MQMWIGLELIRPTGKYRTDLSGNVTILEDCDLIEYLYKI